MTPTTPLPLVLTKHHGSGNDFLVLIDLDDLRPLDGPTVRALCDRRFGVGADGVIRILAGTEGGGLAMDLTNADGTTAEMSGNGMRCLAQAAVDAGLVTPPSFTVATPAGLRAVEYRPGDARGSADATVEMGPVDLGADGAPGPDGVWTRHVDVGNPHLVVLGSDPAAIDVAREGERVQGEHPGGVNVEFISVGPGGDALTLRVFERGVGETLACGTGSVAPPAPARGWGLVGDEVAVHNPGGTLTVAFGPGGVLLSGPVRKVADITVEPAMLLESTALLGAARQ